MNLTKRQESWIALACTTALLGGVFIIAHFRGGSSNVALYLNPTAFLTSHIVVLFQNIFSYFPVQGDIDTFYRISQMQNFLWIALSIFWFVSVSVVLLRILKFSYPRTAVIASGFFVLVVLVTFVKSMIDIGVL